MANRQFTKAEHARRIARALLATCERYQRGYMATRTWDTHMRHLWATAQRHNLIGLIEREFLQEVQ
jgi:hypothetical protein